MTSPSSPLIYKYGLLDPIDWGSDCADQLYLQNQLWNRLVEIEREQRARYRALVDRLPDVAPLQARVEALRAERERLIEERNQRRKQARAKVAATDINARLKLLREAINAAKEVAKEARRAAREQIRPDLDQLHIERREAVKAARNASGLWWGNYNAVCAAYETARGAAMKQGNELQFHRFAGEGRFTVQLILGATVEEITRGDKQVRLDLDPLPVPGKKNGAPRAGKPRPRLSIVIYTRDREPRWLTFPIVYDRPLPPDCRVQEVTVTRRKVGTRYRHEVCFLLRSFAEPVEPRAPARVCGINLGFRRSDTGLRFAAIHDGQSTRYEELPSDWVSAMDDVDDIRSSRDKDLDDVRAAVKAEWGKRPGPDPDFAERLGNLLKAEKCAAASLAAVVLRWREESPIWWPAMLAKLESWRKQDKRRYEIEANKRDHLLASRRERQRLLARRLALEFDLVKVGQIDLRRLSQRDKTTGRDEELHEAARRQRTRAAVSAFLQELSWQAKKRGAAVELIDGPYTRTCHVCKVEGPAVGSDLVQSCPHCLARWDQDDNAARNIFAAPRERSGDGGDSRPRSRPRNQGDSEQNDKAGPRRGPDRADFSQTDAERLEVMQ